MALQTYTGEFTCKRGGKYKAIISYNDLTAQSAQNTDIDVVGASIEYNEVDTENAIISSSFSLSVLSPGDRTFVAMARMDYTQVSVTLYEFSNNAWAPRWFGYLDPAGYSEPYDRFNSYEASFTFTDFGLFKNISVERAQELLASSWYNSSISGGAYPVDFFLSALRPTTLSWTSNPVYPSSPVYNSVTDYQGATHNISLFESVSIQTGQSATDVSYFETLIPYSSVERTNNLYAELEKVLYSAKVYLFQDSSARLCLKSFEQTTIQSPSLISWSGNSQTLELAENYGKFTINFEPTTSESKTSFPLVSEEAVAAFDTNLSALNTAGVVFTNDTSIPEAPANVEPSVLLRDYRVTYRFDTPTTSPLYGHTLYSRQHFDAIEKNFIVPDEDLRIPDPGGHGYTRALSSSFSLLTCPATLSPAKADLDGQPGVQPGSGAVCFHTINQLGGMSETDGFVCQWTKDKTPYAYNKESNFLYTAIYGEKLKMATPIVESQSEPTNPVYISDTINSPYIEQYSSGSNYELLVKSSLLFDIRPTSGVDAPEDRQRLLVRQGIRCCYEKETLTLYKNKVWFIGQPVKIECQCGNETYHYHNIVDSRLWGINPTNMDGFNKISFAALAYMQSAGYWVRQTDTSSNRRKSTYLCYYSQDSFNNKGPIGDGFIENLQSASFTARTIDNSITDNKGEHVTLPYFDSAEKTNCYVYDSNGHLVKDTESGIVATTPMTFKLYVYADNILVAHRGDRDDKVFLNVYECGDFLISTPSIALQNVYSYSVVDQSLNESAKFAVKITDDELSVDDDLELTVSYAAGSATGNYIALSSKTGEGVLTGGIEKFLHTQSGTTYTLKGLDYFTAITLSQFRRDAIKLSGACAPTEPLSVVADSASPGKKFYKTKSTIDLVEGTDEATFTELKPIDYVPA